MNREKAWRVARARGLATSPILLEVVRPHVLTLRAAGVSQRALAAAAGCSATHVRDVELARTTTVQRRLALRLLQVRFDTVVAARRRPTDRVPVTGAMRRVGALLALGHTHAVITAAGGPGWKSEYVTRHVDRGWTYLRIHEAAVAAYAALSMVPGVSSRTRSRALAAGYRTPLCWDDEDLDDPTASPHGERRREEHLDLAEFMWLIGCGESAARAAARCGVTLSAVEQAARRADPIRRDVLAAVAGARSSQRADERAA